MKKKSILLILPSVFLFSALLHAQKPIPNPGLELKMPEENDSYYFNGNNRFLTRTNYPVALYQVNQKVFAAVPEQMARQYLKDHKSLFGLTDTDLQNNLQLHNIRLDEAGATVRLRQFYQGIPVNKNAEITVHINMDYIVDFVMNGFRYGITLNQAQPTITASAAKQIILQHLNLTGSIHFQSNTLMVLQHNNTNRLVYKIVLIADATPIGEWEAYVNAIDGSIIKVEDIACYYNKKNNKNKKKAASVEKAPKRVQVNGTGNVFRPDPLTSAIATYGGSYVDGSDANAAVLTAQLQNISLQDITLTAGTYSLVGPYAAIQDFEAPSKGLFSQASSIFAFDRNADGFEAVNTYFHIDAMMRYLNITLGMAIMPYQYTGGVRFDPSGLSGADNSHYIGSTGRIAFGEGGVDDAEDADVIIHELGHGLHDWFTVGGLSQVNGLSEGTGDYIAGSYSRGIGYWPTGNVAYNWMFNWDGHNPFWGGRILNYAAVYPGGLTGSIHTDGQIWATANMKIWDDIGKQKADKVFWGGLSTTNSSTNQNDAANAVYTRATALGYTNAERLAIHTRYTAAGYILPSFTLPMKIVQFKGHKQNKEIQLNFTVSNETAGSVYTIEKSQDGVTFFTIGALNAIANNQNNSYVWKDVNPFSGRNYYRIKETTPNGLINYSFIIQINFESKNEIQLSPNPSKDFVQVICNGISGKIKINIFNASGNKVMEKDFTVNGMQPIRINVADYPGGIYTLQLIKNQLKINKALSILK